MNAGVQINGDTFCTLWADFYSARAVLLTELSKNAQTTAEGAHERVDDIVSDGIISAGSEKSLLSIDWLKTVAEYWKYMEQAGDYTDPEGTENRYVVNTTAFTTTFTELATMLNNGVTATERILAGTDRPSWLDADHINADTVLANTPILTADAYRTKWKNYSTALTALLEVITKRAKELADAAQADATAALSKISDMANDGKLVPDEKLTVKREFLAAWHERDDEGGILDKCKTPSAANPNVQVYINDTIEAAYVTPYLNAFKAVGSYLNGRSNNSPVTWNGITITSSTTDAQIEAAMPAWLKEAAMSTTNDIDGDDWRNVWATFYSARTALLTALSEDAKDRADDALEKIGDIVDDGIISGGSEKNLLYIQWMKAAYEYVRYVEQAHDYGVSVTAFETAYTNLVKMLNGNTNPTDNMLQGITPPLWLNSEANNANNISHDTTLSDFGLTAVTYRDKWNAYHSALAAMLEAIDLEAKQRADDAQSDATEALEAIDGIAADGTLSVTEIPDLRREFEAAYRQRAEMVDLATSDSTYKLIDATLRSPLDDYLSKFKLLANYLNRGTAWTEPSGGTYSINNGQNVADANATYNVVAKSLLVVADFPSLLKIEADVKFVADWSANPLVEDNGAAFRNLWASLTTAQVALANAMATLAKNNADNAQQTADDAQDEITADSVLSRIEKKQVRKEFEAIIRNKQYNLILATQFDVANSDYGTDSNGNSIVTQYTTAYNNLGKYLNGDFESGSSSSWTADTVPAWLADLTNDQDIVPATYRSYWVNYYDKENALLNAISSIAKKAGDDALAKLQDIASDGKITPSEKNTILISWREIISELPIICGQADTFYTQTENSDLTLYKGDYLAAFGTLAQILNDGDTYSYNISTGNFPTPKWLSQYLTRTETLTSQAKDDFNEAWDNYYAERTYLQDLLLEVAKKPGDDALGELDNLAADNILTEFEKLTTLREWDAARTEHTDLVTKAQYAHVSYSAYENAYYKLGNYLVDLTTNGTSNRQGNTVHNKTIDGETYNFSVDYANPLMLCIISGNTNISGSTFKEYWSAYYNERSKLLSAIANHHINIFTGDSNPTPPYSVGDYWIKSDNSEWVCVYPRGIGESYNSSDWRDMRDITEKRDPRVVLAGFAEKIYPLVSGYISGSYVTAFWNNSTPQNYNNGDIWYNGSTVYQRISGSWVENTSVIVKGAFVAVDGVLDVMNRTSIRLYGTRQNISPSKYDLFLHTITYTDPYLDNNNQYKTLESGVEILMYNGDNDWETLRESVRSVIDKLNDYIRMLVFGTTNGNLTASGAVVKSDFVSMFATATNSSGQTITQAYLSAYVTKDSNGILESGVKIKADKIDFEGGTLKISADNIALSGNDQISLLVNGVKDGLANTGINIQNGTITLNASNTIINGNLNLYDAKNNGLTIYDAENFARVNIQSDSIGSIAQMANDTYTYHTASTSISTTSFNNPVTSSNIGTLSAGRVIEIDNINITTYGSNSSYPSTYYATLKIEILNASTVVATKSVSLTRQTSYGNYKATSGVRFVAKTDGTYYVRYTISGISSTATSPVYLMVNARIQTSDTTETFIGADGMYAHSGAHKIFWMGESELQIRFGFGGIRWNDADKFANKGMEVVANIKGSSPNYKPVWLPFYNYVPTFEVGVGTTPYLFTSQNIGNLSETKYAFRIDPYRDRGICVVHAGYIDTNGNQQESWIVLPPSTFTDADGNSASLPIGYQVTIINWTSVNIYVAPYSNSKHGAVIVDGNRNTNYYCDLNSTQSRDTYIYVGNWAGLGETWLSMHDTQ